jgi:hypothetical protein
MTTVTYVLGTFVTLVSSPYKGGHWGICRRCFESGAAHFHLLCCTDWYMNYFAGNFPISRLVQLTAIGHLARVRNSRRLENYHAENVHNFVYRTRMRSRRCAFLGTA